MVTPDLASEEDIAKLIIPNDLPDEQSTFRAYVEAKVYDKEGHLIQHHRQPMRSLTRYFLALMSVPVIGTYQGASINSAPSVLTNTLGLPSSISGTNAGNILWDWAIQLGSGTQAFSPTLTSLAAPILNGTGAGELSYGSLSASYSGGSIYVSLQVTNTTSSSISVTEIGITSTVYLQYSSGSKSTYNFLLSYDTFSTPISVPAYGMAVFQITLSFTG